MERAAEEKMLRSQVRERIRNRIYGIWFFRYAAPLFLLEIVFLYAAFRFFSRFVFVERVVSNALLASLGNPIKLITYLWWSFLSTSFGTQLVVVFLAAAMFLFLREVNRSIVAYVAMKRSEFRSRE